MHVPLLSFHWVQVNRVRVSKRQPCLSIWDLERVWDVETNLERGFGGWWGGQQPRAKQVGKEGFVEPKCCCVVLPWVDSSYLW